MLIIKVINRLESLYGFTSTEFLKYLAKIELFYHEGSEMSKHEGYGIMYQV